MEDLENLPLPGDELLGFVDCSNEALSNGCTSADSFMEEMLQSMHTCTHRHFCSPPGPDNTHTHTCSHTHTQLVSAPELSSMSGEKNSDTDTKRSNSKKRPQGNREAVRKYREKKKAHTALLQEELDKQKALNIHLMRRLQAQGALEAEVARLRCLLTEIRGKVEAEVGPRVGKRYPEEVLSSGKAAIRLIPATADQHALPGGQFYLTSVELPCEPLMPCVNQSSRLVRAHSGSAQWPSMCDVAQGDCLSGKADIHGREVQCHMERTGDCLPVQHESHIPPLPMSRPSFSK